MTSVYEYISLADLELYMSIDFSALTKPYSTAEVDSWITQSERMVNSHAKKSFAGTIPDNVIYITTDISYKTAINRLIDDGLDPTVKSGKKAERYNKLWDKDEYDPMLNNVQNFYAAGYARVKGV